MSDKMQNAIHQITEAAKGVTLAMEKFTGAVQHLNDLQIYANNDVQANQPVATAPNTGQVVQERVGNPGPPGYGENLGSVELDDEGCPWDERIHAGSKGKVNSKTVTGGKAWRKKKGVDEDEYKRIRDDLIARYRGATSNTAQADNTQATQAAPTVPGTPGAPSSPAAPGVPGTPQAPATETGPSDEVKQAWEEGKAQVISLAKTLVDTHGLEFSDVQEIMVQEFGAPEGDGQLVFGSLRFDQIDDVVSKFALINEKYTKIREMRDNVYKYAGEPYASNIDEQLKQLLSQFNTEEYGGIHYTELDKAIPLFEEWNKSWYDFGVATGTVQA